MPAHPIKDRLTPYRLLAFLLYSPTQASHWIERIDNNQVRIYTGPCSRTFRLKIADIWQHIYWLEEQGLLEKVRKEKKRGTAVIRLKQPTNINQEAI